MSKNSFLPFIEGETWKVHFVLQNPSCSGSQNLKSWVPSNPLRQDSPACNGRNDQEIPTKNDTFSKNKSKFIYPNTWKDHWPACSILYLETTLIYLKYSNQLLFTTSSVSNGRVCTVFTMLGCSLWRKAWDKAISGLKRFSGSICNKPSKRFFAADFQFGFGQGGLGCRMPSLFNFLSYGLEKVQNWCFLKRFH